MRLAARVLLAAASAILPVAFALASCTTDAENVEGCRQIEGLRCDLAPQCSPGFDVDACKRFYRDACLVGTAYPDAAANLQIEGCLDALKACAAADAGDCPGLAPEAKCLDGDGGVLQPTSCNVVMHCPEALTACAWVTAPAAADAAADADATADGDSTADGDAATDGDTGDAGATGDAADDGAADAATDGPDGDAG